MNNVLERWNDLPTEAAIAELLSSCGSRAWANAVTERRPYAASEDLFSAAEIAWQSLGPEDWMEAFRSHPRIGEWHAERSTTPTSAAWSAAEQKNIQQADVGVRRAIEEGNMRYEERFGRIFIVCAAGKQPAEILAILERRLANDDETEMRESANQQGQILQLRLRKWLGARF
ncbi:MAG TPA: 2-oxo-4-hydroxy-4-carboxy-5-ureidoimidazoline decarboxylase [Acidobacteriaceae bacterium]